MEQRVQQFHDDTKTIPKPPTAKTLKQMNTLKKFIFKNQVERVLTDRVYQPLILEVVHRTIDSRIKRKTSCLLV